MGNNDFDTSFAKTISKIMGTKLSLYSNAGHALLNNINIESFTFGQQHITRPISSPYDDVFIDRRFSAPDQVMLKEVQDLDLINISKRVVIDSVDYAADPAHVAKQVEDALNIIKDGIEKAWIEGSTAKVTMYGVKDAIATGLINRPDTIVQTTTGKWEIITNLQFDVADAVALLIGKRFYGPYALLAPSALLPMLSQVQTTTAVPVSTWVQNALGLPVIFSPAVDSDAVMDTAFDCYVIDLSKVHIGLSDLKIDAYYSNKDHCYMWDMEIFMSALFDPLHDDTEYKKGVATLLARDWTT